ncbi:hypothetical protein BVRB_6g143570 [Beta vulgaris subsp. vulgaris]|nr:hypothetical protein BVRB_6g143570 [Beta vulgaris subsp. vulgaris]
MEERRQICIPVIENTTPTNDVEPESPIRSPPATPPSPHMQNSSTPNATGPRGKRSIAEFWPLWGYAILCILLNVHGLNIYFWLSFIPVILVMLVGTKLEHVVSLLALEIAEPAGRSTRTQVKPRDELFWFGKPEMILWLIQFVSFQNAFEMATFIWSLVSSSLPSAHQDPTVTSDLLCLC